VSGEHRCAPGQPHVPLGWLPSPDGPVPGPGAQQQHEPGKPQQRESVTLNGTKGGDGKR
jgi:hypothetical protein